MENQNLIKRGSIFYYDLGATDGSVQSGTRPVMIVQNDKGNFYSPTLIVVPITSVPKKFCILLPLFFGGLFNNFDLLIMSTLFSLIIEYSHTYCSFYYIVFIRTFQ
ncbi:MAG: type II toxin-antitoxin system PemK/MazF family toxin [Eubacterium sp.]|nr:type II toxin-antitoxin system PemK/MazF family toxin [Eubacterium sp.]